MNLIAKVDENETATARPFRVPFTLDARLFDSLNYLEDALLLEKLVFNIARKPRHLLSHVQRIFLCYKNAWSDYLFAAFLDFFIVLDGRGTVLSLRLLAGAKSVLAPDHFQILQAFFTSTGEVNQQYVSQFSIFSAGLEGSLSLVKPVSPAQALAYDPLSLARDYIEYSQLEQAKQVLEQAVWADAERVELQEELLGLYQSTRDRERFVEMHSQLQVAGFSLIGQWTDLHNFFKRQDDNG